MNNKLKQACITLLVTPLLALSSQALSQNNNRIYLGGGVSLNDYDGISDDAVGFQLFAGMPLPVKLQKGRLLAEVGYMDAGEADVNVNVPGVGTSSAKADAEGIWANAVIEFPVQDNLDLLGRIGLDFGDDDGIMLGGGIGIPVSKKMDLRFEYVIRDNINSLQANLAFEL